MEIAINFVRRVLYSVTPKQFVHDCHDVKSKVKHSNETTFEPNQQIN